MKALTLTRLRIAQGRSGCGFAVVSVLVVNSAGIYEWRVIRVRIVFIVNSVAAAGWQLHIGRWVGILCECARPPSIHPSTGRESFSVRTSGIKQTRGFRSTSKPFLEFHAYFCAYFLNE